MSETPFEIPFELRSLNAKDAGVLLGYSARHVRERLAALPDFPKRCDTGGDPRWIAAELLKWRGNNVKKRVKGNG